MTESIFNRSVETAISLSLQTKRYLLVLISTNEDSDDSRWADRLLNLSEVQTLIKDHFIPLEVVRDTQEYQFFNQIFPVQKVPSIFIINQSLVVDRFDGEISSDEFLERLSRSFGESNGPVGSSSSGEATPSETDEVENDTSSNNQPVSAAGSSCIPASSNDSDIIASTPNIDNAGNLNDATNTTNNINTISGDGSDSPITATTTTTTTTSSPDTSYTTTSTNPVSSPPSTTTTPAPIESTTATTTTTTPKTGLSDTQKYQLEMKKQRQAEKDERKRILRLLKADREEKKAQRLLHQQELQEQQQPEVIKKTRSLSLTSPNQCALVIRLFDGQALKNIFDNTDSLEIVRQWVDKTRTDSDEPYQFFQTFPKRSFGPGEETSSLLELQLCPSSTLILKPVQNVLNAYSSSYSPSSWLNVGTRSLTGAIYTFLGIGYRPPPPPEPITTESTSSSSRPTPNDTPRSPSRISTPLNRPNLDTPTNAPSNASNSKVATPIHSPTPLSISSFPNSAQNELHRSKPNSISNSRSSSVLNIRTLHDGEDTKDDRLTYNGNQLNLEDDNDKKK